MKNGLTIFLVMFALSSAWGQNSDYIGVKDGLSQGLVVVGLQDTEGFLWFGTASGLNRYDGRNFKTFYHNPFDSTSLRSNRIYALADAGKHLLIGTGAGGLDAYNKKSGLFHPVVIGIARDALDLGKLRISRIVNGGTQGYFGLFTVPDANSYFIQFQLAEDEYGELMLTDPGILLVNVGVGDVSIEPNHTFLYVGTEEGLLRADLREQTISFQKIPCPAGMMGSNFTIAKDGKVWIVSRNLLGCFYEGEWRTWRTDFSGITLGIIPDQNLVIPTEDNQLLTFSFPLPLTDSLSATKATHRETLAFARARTPILDNSENLWFGSSGRGLLKIDPRKKRFTTLLKRMSLRNHLNFNVAKSGGYFFGPKMDLTLIITSAVPYRNGALGVYGL